MEDTFDKEIENWEGYCSALREPDRTLFKEMLEGTRQFKDAVNLKDELPTETLLMALLLQQQKMINELMEKYTNNQKQITSFFDSKLDSSPK